MADSEQFDALQTSRIRETCANASFNPKPEAPARELRVACGKDTCASGQSFNPKPQAPARGIRGACGKDACASGYGLNERLHAPAFWLLTFTLVLSGCGGQDGPPRGTVHGTVYVEGQPVAAGTVYFENVSTGVAVGAAIETDGSYRVSTYEGEGLPAGKYQVAISPQRIATTDENPLAGDMRPTIEVVSVEIPERYHRAGTSDLEVTVAEGDNPPFDFDLQP
jgi:hypothetical protein